MNLTYIIILVLYKTEVVEVDGFFQTSQKKSTIQRCIHFNISDFEYELQSLVIHETKIVVALVVQRYNVSQNKDSAPTAECKILLLTS